MSTFLKHITLFISSGRSFNIFINFLKESSLSVVPPLSIFVFLFHFSMVNFLLIVLLSVQFSSVDQSCLTLCDPMNRSTSGLPVHHQLPEVTQTHIHRVGNAIQPSHPLSSPSSPAPNPSQHQGLFQ